MIGDKELMGFAIAARHTAYAPYSAYQVGAALITEDGQLFTGCNVENASYGATCCAERTAVFKAVSEGKRRIKKIAIAGGKGDGLPYHPGAAKYFAEQGITVDAANP